MPTAALSTRRAMTMAPSFLKDVQVRSRVRERQFCVGPSAFFCCYWGCTSCKVIRKVKKSDEHAVGLIFVCGDIHLHTIVISSR